jgi:hypothetical protein
MESCRCLCAFFRAPLHPDNVTVLYFVRSSELRLSGCTGYQQEQTKPEKGTFAAKSPTIGFKSLISNLTIRRRLSVSCNFDMGDSGW